MSRALGRFKWTYIERASFRDPPLKFLKFLWCVGIEILNLKDFMELLQKTYLFLVQMGQCLKMHLKSIGYTDPVFFPTSGQAGDVLTPYFSKPDLYPRKK